MKKRNQINRMFQPYSFDSIKKQTLEGLDYAYTRNGTFGNEPGSICDQLGSYGIAVKKEIRSGLLSQEDEI